MKRAEPTLRGETDRPEKALAEEHRTGSLGPECTKWDTPGMRLRLLCLALVAGCETGELHFREVEPASAALPPSPEGASGAAPTAETPEPPKNVGPQGMTDAGPDCATATSIIAASLSAGPACTAIVRVASTTMVPLGWQVWCGDAKSNSDPLALVAPQLANAHPGSFVEITHGAPEPWVVFAAPLDFGGLGIVSTHTGGLVFAGSVEHMGYQKIRYPQTWRSAAELSSGCDPLPKPPLQGWLWSQVAGDPAKALDVVWSTALPRAVTKSEVPVAYVVGYPNAFAPGPGWDGPDWLVVVESSRE